jgi:hypothetical protein
VTLHEIVCNDWFGSVVFVSGSRDIHTRGFDFLQADGFSFRIYSFAPSLPYISDMVLIFRADGLPRNLRLILPNV